MVNHRPHFLRNFAQKALHGEPINTHRYKNGSPCLDLLHACDLERGIAEICKREFEGEINLGGGVFKSTEEIASLLVKLAGSKSPVLRHDIDDHFTSLVVDLSHAENELSWHPQQDLAEGLAIYLNLGRDDYERSKG
jgi:nucleoside-diphosphate-sugar epimerase